LSTQELNAIFENAETLITSDNLSKYAIFAQLLIDNDVSSRDDIKSLRDLVSSKVQQIHRNEVQRRFSTSFLRSNFHQL